MVNEESYNEMVSPRWTVNAEYLLMKNLRENMEEKTRTLVKPKLVTALRQRTFTHSASNRGFAKEKQNRSAHPPSLLTRSDSNRSLLISQSQRYQEGKVVQVSGSSASQNTNGSNLQLITYAVMKDFSVP